MVHGCRFQNPSGARKLVGSILQIFQKAVCGLPSTEFRVIYVIVKITMPSTNMSLDVWQSAYF